MGPPMAESLDESEDEHEMELRRRARDIAHAKMDFYKHLAAYVVVNAFMLALDLLTTPGNLWFYWVMLGWGIGLAAHAFSVYVRRTGETWYRKIEQRELDRMRQEHDRSIGL